MLWMARSHPLFLSTLSLRRATLELFLYYQDNMNFYPRSPCGERRVTVLGIQHKVGISIHALLAESDHQATNGLADAPPQFLSTLSLRRATISCAWSASKLGDFYPRSPCGERLSLLRFRFFGFVISIHALLAESDCITIITICTALKFLSTLSLRRATSLYQLYINRTAISIHALLAESDITQTYQTKL